MPYTDFLTARTRPARPTRTFQLRTQASHHVRPAATTPNITLRYVVGLSVYSQILVID